MAVDPLVLSPALPPELLSYIVTRQSYPTTLVVCCSRDDFVSALINDVHDQITGDAGAAEDKPSSPRPAPETSDTSLTAARRLLSAPLYQVAIARHIRIVFVPTVSHLRAFLSIFSPDDSNVSRPPAQVPARTGLGHQTKSTPLLVVYGFLGLHRDTSEWSAQGLSSTAAGLIEKAKRLRFQPIIVEPRYHRNGGDFEEELDEILPVLSGSARKLGADMEDLGWAGRTVELRRILRRWFSFRDGEWQGERGRGQPVDPQQLLVEGDIDPGSFIAQ